MKILLITIFLFVTPLFAYASLSLELKKEIETINYLQREMISLRFRRLYAAESAKNKSLTATSENVKIVADSAAKVNLEAAEYALEVSRALNQRIREINKQLKGDGYTENCSNSYEVYGSASKYLLGLNYAGVISRKSFNYIERIYGFSNSVASLLCKSENTY